MAKHCSFEGCGRELTSHSARGLCSGHYQQWKNGRSLQPLQARNVVLPWLEDHVGFGGDECLIWPFYRDSNGYGTIKYQRKPTWAHRLMCELAHGAPPTPKHHAAHSCGKGHLGCVNPRHLRWATCQENLSDTIIHGTRARGERQGHAKLTAADVLAIRSRIGVASQCALGREYGVTQSTIYKIVHRQSWGHL